MAVILLLILPILLPSFAKLLRFLAESSPEGSGDVLLVGFLAVWGGVLKIILCLIILLLSVAADVPLYGNIICAVRDQFFPLSVAGLLYLVAVLLWGWLR